MHQAGARLLNGTNVAAAAATQDDYLYDPATRHKHLFRWIFLFCASATTSYRGLLSHAEH